MKSQLFIRTRQLAAQTALMGPLLLGWMNELLNVPGLARFSEASCGNDRVRMVDVSERL